MVKEGRDGCLFILFNFFGKGGRGGYLCVLFLFFYLVKEGGGGCLFVLFCFLICCLFSYFTYIRVHTVSYLHSFLYLL